MTDDHLIGEQSPDLVAPQIAPEPSDLNLHHFRSCIAFPHRADHTGLSVATRAAVSFRLGT